MTLRGQTLFYTDVVEYLRQIFSLHDYEYRDDFVGDLIISKTCEVIYIIEIKSEIECKFLSKTNGEAFKELREKINSLKIFNSLEGKYNGWLAIIAQPYDYFKFKKLPDDIKQKTFKSVEIVIAIPKDKLEDCEYALNKVSEEYKIAKPVYRKLYKTEFNITVLFFGFADLDMFFTNILKTE